MPERTCIIVGASHAGVQLALSLRQGGWTGKILLISDEPVAPYQRPPLSKSVLDGSKSPDAIALRPAALYEKSNIELLLGRRVTRVDRQNKTVELDDGNFIRFDKLALTPGSRPRTLPLTGHDQDGVFYLRSLADVEQMRPCIDSGSKVVIVGGGYIGLEAAAVLRKRGMEVTVIEAMPRVLQRVTAPVVSEFFERIHREEGVKLLTGIGVVSIAGSGRAEHVICVDGTEHAADLVIIAVGVVPNTELAVEAGLEVDNGIRVNDFAQCSDTEIVAAGDCTSFYSSLYRRHIRLESVQNATDQAKAAAAALNGAPHPFEAVPWFWSEQYNVKLQIAGLSQGHDSIVIRGNPEQDRSFAVFYFSGNRLLAVDAINRPAEFMAGKRLIGSDVVLDKARLPDESIPIKEFLSL
jgi:3-phenylpropionate/trans-cinnamate dioxygenase ferredoxin reductase subunit